MCFYFLNLLARRPKYIFLMAPVPVCLAQSSGGAGDGATPPPLIRHQQFKDTRLPFLSL